MLTPNRKHQTLTPPARRTPGNLTVLHPLFVCVCLRTPCNAYTSWQGLNVRQESPKLEQLAFLFYFHPQKSSILPVFSRLRSKSLHSSSDWLLSSRHRCIHTCLYPPLHAHTHPPPTSWGLSLVWVTCPTPPDVGQPPRVSPQVVRPVVIKLQRISGRLKPKAQQPPRPTLDVPHHSVWARHFKSQDRTVEEKKDGDTIRNST